MKDERGEEMIPATAKETAVLIGGMLAGLVVWFSVAWGVVILIWKAAGNE